MKLNRDIKFGEEIDTWNLKILTRALESLKDFHFKDAEATRVKIATEMKKCSRLKEMSNFNVL